MAESDMEDALEDMHALRVPPSGERSLSLPALTLFRHSRPLPTSFRCQKATWKTHRKICARSLSLSAIYERVMDANQTGDWFALNHQPPY